MPRRLPPLLALLAMLAGALFATAGEVQAVPSRELKVVLDNARAYLLSQQREDGSFGGVQPHMQTSLALLALHIGPPEFFMLMLFALTTVAGVSGNSLLLGMVSAALGLF